MQLKASLDWILKIVPSQETAATPKGSSIVRVIFSKGDRFLGVVHGGTKQAYDWTVYKNKSKTF